MNTTLLRRAGALLAAGGFAFGLVACGDDDKPAEQGIAITDAWARTSPMNAQYGAAYMTIVSPVDDALIAASVDSSVAAKVELHETVAAETTMPETTMPGTTMPGGGMMEMRPVDRIALPAGNPVLLVPGGYHVMLIDLAAPLQVGTSISMTLNFEKSGTQTVSVPVRDSAP